MPYQPVKPRTELSFLREEWDLLVTLPGRLVVAATVVGSAPPRRGVAEGLAGIDAIAAGRSSVSRLVRDVVAAIYEADDDRPVPVTAPDRRTAIAEVLIACRSAASVLAERASREDADAYQHWLEAIAARVGHAARAGALFGPPERPMGEAERAFLAALSHAFEG